MIGKYQIALHNGNCKKIRLDFNLIHILCVDTFSLVFDIYLQWDFNL